MFNISLDVKTEQGRDLITSFSMSVNQGDCIGIIGEEGNGKSVFLKSLMLDASLYDLKINRKLSLDKLIFGYVGQELTEYEQNLSIMDFVLNEDWNRYGEFISLYQSMLPTLTEADLERTVKSLSGGERVRIQLLKLQVHQADCYLLDEPTNNLDIEGLKWFEGWLKVRKIPIFLVSHDIKTLKNTANRILHFEQLHRKSLPQLTLYEGTYDTYMNVRSRSLKHHQQQLNYQLRQQTIQEEKWQKQYQKVGHQLQNVNRADPGLQKKMKNLKVQKKRRLRDENLVHRDIETAITFQIENQVQHRKTVLQIHIECLENADRVLGTHYHYKLSTSDKVALIGNNGCGKTTLFHEIVRQSNGNVGVMHQDYRLNLDFTQSAISNCTCSLDKEELTKVRAALGGLNFTTDEMECPVALLSGGQKAKISFLKILLKEPVVLLLDEPTRNLSPLSVSVIYDMLKRYQGAILCITHDRQLIECVFEDVLDMTKTGFKNISVTE